MNSVNPVGHFYASVPHDPVVRVLGERADRFPEREARVAMMDETLARARQSGSRELVCEICAAISDYHLERGKLQAARAALLEGLVMAAAPGLELQQLALERRDAWLDYLCGYPSAEARLQEARATAKTLGSAFEVAVISLYLALLSARKGRTDVVHGLVSGALGTLRSLGDTPALTRLALLGAMAYAGAGQPEAAEIQALRVRAYARTHQVDDLLIASESILATVRPANTQDQRVHHLVSVAIDVGRLRSLSEVLDAVVASTLSLLGAERAFVIRLENGENVMAASAFEPGHGGLPSASIVARAIDEAREVVSANLEDDAQLARARSIIAMGLRTAICVPMMDGPTVIGALYADSCQVSTEELYERAWLVRAFAAHAVAALRTAEYLEATQLRIERAREMHHDVRNLISTLRMGLTEVYDDAVLEPWSKATIAELVQVTLMIQRQVDGHLTETRGDPIVFDFGRLVAGVCEFMRFDGREKGVTVSFSGIDSVGVKGRVDDITRLVLNLVGNAIKYAPHGSAVEVTVSATGSSAVLEVRDHGPGIPPDQLHDIFRSGVQAKGHQEGLGLGLAICLRVAEEANGMVEASNAADGGSIFRFVAPRVNRR